MDIATILLIIIAVGTSVAIFLLLKKKPESEKKEDGSLLMLQQQINNISQALASGISDLSKITQSQFSQNTNVLERVTEKISKIEETNKQVLGFTETLQSFQNVMTGQKKRGAQGEIMLESILKNVLPPALYKIQYEFKNGDKVDAVIIVEKDKIIPSTKVAQTMIEPIRSPKIIQFSPRLAEIIEK